MKRCLVTDAVSVSPDDVRTVTAVLSIAAAAYGSVLGNVPGFGAALEACARMSGAAPEVMPEDPVNGIDQTAIANHELMLAWERADFTREEAFALTLAVVQAGAQAAVLQAARGL
jgi:hypothetical protein